MSGKPSSSLSYVLLVASRHDLLHRGIFGRYIYLYKYILTYIKISDTIIYTHEICRSKLHKHHPKFIWESVFFPSICVYKVFSGSTSKLVRGASSRKNDIFFFTFKPHQKENLGKSSQLSLAQAFCSCPGRARSHLLKQFSVAFRLCTLFLIRNHLLMASSSIHVLPKVGFNKEGLESETI